MSKPQTVRIKVSQDLLVQLTACYRAQLRTRSQQRPVLVPLVTEFLLQLQEALDRPARAPRQAPPLP